MQYPLQGLTSMMNAFSLAAFTTSLELNPFDEDYKVIKTFADRFLADFHPVSWFLSGHLITCTDKQIAIKV